MPNRKQAQRFCIERQGIHIEILEKPQLHCRDLCGDVIGSLYRDSERQQIGHRDLCGPNFGHVWSFTLYDIQARAMLQTDVRFPAIGSNDTGLKQNEYGSYDIYFAPEALEG